MKFQHGEKSRLQCQASACGARKGIRASGPSSQLLILREVQIFSPSSKSRRAKSRSSDFRIRRNQSNGPDAKPKRGGVYM